MNALEIQNLHKTYTDKKGEKIAVDDVNLTVKQGEFFGLLGQNGAGKSTMISCITGINQFTTGSILVMGHDIEVDYQQARLAIGLSPQDFNVDVFAKIEKSIDLVGGYFGMSKADRNTRAQELFELFDLVQFKDKPFQALSGGFKRRYVLARALMHDPDVLILDEPTAGIDVEQRRALWKYLQELHKQGKTIILTSHYLEEVELLCDRVAVMNHGKIIADLTKAEFTKGGAKLEDTYLKLTESI
ncbi:ABC transporter ATP-binding protein [Candidatus Uhrbacteria bacterium CG_4_9_14_3_um_filter_41_35]|uniref:ABC transporter ATP-binding protein n=1 Tax=Candidatus Uhrbacteria bacterium CG_4_9_14_3_um_filter_41_35 TaxID=1975034 RepID=A0A2M7XFS4_9BACT|nr:MAG: ABC transporter ATP-binding protein [Candidatus Uhrbacteria bacterium CG_4_9_14_3_um_filter_41_35]